MEYTESLFTVSAHFEDRKEYLYVRIEGRGSYEQQKEVWEQIADELKASSHFRLLVEQNSRTMLDMSDVFQLSADVAAMGLDDCKSAYVDTNETNADINEFAETVAINRGFNGKVFTSVEEAEAWLLSN